MTVIHWLTNSISSYTSYSPLFFDIQLWLISYPLSKVSHMRSEGNQATDFLAHLTLTGDVYFLQVMAYILY